MPGRLYPLLMKPGIARDGTSFQAEYCTDAQWMRFQRGKPRKMGGYAATQAYTEGCVVTSLMIYDAEGRQNVALGLRNPNNDNKTDLYVNGKLIHPGWSSPGYLLFERAPVTPNTLPQLWSNYVRDTGTEDSGQGINSAAENALFLDAGMQKNEKIKAWSEIKDPLNIPALKNVNAGMRYVAPYMFQWGMDGKVVWSSPADTTIFYEKDEESNLTGAGSMTISNDKVIQGYPIRAGAQSPAVLFWTLNSLVRVLNVGVDQVIFKADVISKNVSILSRLSVVEVDGLFFWPGTDRFFVYNGTVQEIPNTLNLNWFFDNIDKNRRQQVVGVRNQKYGEIWWFYPDKRDNKPYNTRALIYNKRENTWYDTQINRDAAWYDDATGSLFAAGQNLAEDGAWQLWRHEQGTVGQNEDRTVFPIPAVLQTPVISWAAVGPQKEEVGLDRLITLKRLEPDFILTKGVPEEKDPALTVQVKTREYAQSPETTTLLPDPVTPKTEKLTTEISGRQMSLVFSSEDDFEVGNPLLQFDVGAAQ